MPSHADCNLQPHLERLYRDTRRDAFRGGDAAALIAPRPLCIVNGEHDGIFPIDAAREQFEHVRKVYAALDAADNCDHAVHPDDHRFDHDLCSGWLERWGSFA